jgi:hypothetical protein
VRVGQVRHINEIANAGPVPRRIVGPEHADACAAARCRLAGYLDEMRCL